MNEKLADQNTPVYGEAYQGWRAWSVSLAEPKAPRLHALWKQDSLWPPLEKATASCPLTAQWRPWHGRRRRPMHEPSLVPEFACTCGFVSLPDPASGIEYLEDWEHFIQRQHKYRRRHLLSQRYGTARPLPVFGRVALWGNAVEHESHMRAEAGLIEHVSGIRTRYGYPQELWLPAKWWDQQELDTSQVALALAEDYKIPVHPIIDLNDIVLAWQTIQGLSQD